MTYIFDLVTEASPQRVWAVLTTPELTAEYLSGLGGPIGVAARQPHHVRVDRTAGCACPHRGG